MRKYLYLIIAVLISACNNVKIKNGFVLTGKLLGIEDGKIIMEYNENTDTSIVKNGYFKFIGKLEEPTACTIKIPETEIEKSFYLENSNITFQANIDAFSNASIEGSQLHTEYIEYEEMLRTIDEKYNYDVLNNEWDSANDERRNKLELMFYKYDAEVLSAKIQFIIDHPDSYYSPIILWDIDYSFKDASEFDELVKKINPKLYEFSYFIKIAEVFEQLRKVEVGKIAPDFTMLDTDSNSVNMNRLCNKSKYLLINFWASGCGPCRVESPNLVNMYKKYNQQGFNILGVSTDTNKKYLEDAIDQDKLEWTNVCNFKKWYENEVVQLYALRQQSENVLLDSSGKIIAKNIKGEKLQLKLEELFAN